MSIGGRWDREGVSEAGAHFCPERNPTSVCSVNGDKEHFLLAPYRPWFLSKIQWTPTNDNPFAPLISGVANILNIMVIRFEIHGICKEVLG